MSDELSRFFGTLNQRLEDARQAERRALERFFVELGPRLETARTLERELDRQLARRFSVFDYLRTDELGLSKMIGDLLDPAGSHGQGAAFLKCLTDRLEFAKGCNLSDSKVYCERTITGGRRIDITVEIEGRHCLAIENKANYAGDQHRQVEDYLCWLESNYSESLLVYLTPTGEGPSEDSVCRNTIDELKDELKKEGTRRLAIMPCGPSGELDDTFDYLRLSFSLADWLADCRRGCDVDRLRRFLREAEIFCRRRYGGTTVTTTENRIVEAFVLAHPENMETALAVYKSWPAIAVQIKRDFLKLIYEKLEEDAGWRKNTEICYKYDEEKESYIRIYRKNWQPYGTERTYIYLGLQNHHDGIVYISVMSISTAAVDEKDRTRREKLQDTFREHYRYQDVWFPGWEWVDKKYKKWNDLTPRLHQECQAGGGEITNYFVGKFKKVFEQAEYTIDGIDGKPGEDNR